MAIALDKFKPIVSLVIDKLEGGYYHPQMLADGRVKDSRYGSSGETMFGIDRRAGGTINTTPSGIQFWKLIDNVNASKTWKWNYMGGTLAPQLKELAGGMIYPVYTQLSNKYLNDTARSIVDSDKRLTFHFIYATWNGAGWFKKFATDMNKAVDSGITDKDKLVQVAIDSRTKEGLKTGSSPNSLIAQGGNKIAGFINDLREDVVAGYEATKKKIKEHPIVTIAITTVLIVAGFLLYKTLISKK